MSAETNNKRASGVPPAPEHIFQEYAARVYSLARQQLGNDTDADGVTQDVFVQVARKLPTSGPAWSATGQELVCAFNELRTDLVSTLFYVIGNYEDAQDVAQNAFLKCWRNRERVWEVRNLRAWIFRIGLNAAKDLQRNAWRRRARRLLGPSTLVQTHDACPVKSAEERESKERLQRAIQNLRPKEREVFLLRQNGGLTYEEIAKLRRTPVGTVKTQMRAAIAKLRQVLGRNE